jgi:transcriptional regulator with XRE-family HTH domain
LTFHDAQHKLLAYVRGQIRNGELTERGFARLIGISQPHMHNVLKGVRNLSPEFLDLALKYLHLSLLDLVPSEELEAHLRNRYVVPRGAEIPFLDSPIGPGRPWPTAVNPRKKFPFPLRPEQISGSLVMANLLPDSEMQSTLDASDVALLDTSEIWTSVLTPEAVFVVERDLGNESPTAAGKEAVLRFIRPGARHYYLATDASLDDPSQWEPLRAPLSEMRAVVKARVRWIGRERDRDPNSQRGRFLDDPTSS